MNNSSKNEPLNAKLFPGSSGLYVPQGGRSSEISELHQTLPARRKMVLGDIAGPGVIGQIYLVNGQCKDELPALAARGVIIRCYWDGESHPSVEVPLNDFFGIGFGRDRRLNCAAWQRDGRFHQRIMLPMPFKKRALIELENLTDRDLSAFYWCIEYDEGVTLPENLEYFHAQYRQSHPVPKIGSHTVLETEGHGKYIGTIWSVNWFGAGCSPENAFNFFIDGKPIQGVNSEDYFGQSWGFRSDVYNMLYVGQSLEMEKTDMGSTQMSSYRIHLPNPILFQQSLQFTLDNQGYNCGYRTDSYDTVAFWYQSHPHLPFPPLPPVEELFPIHYARSYWRGLWEIHQAEKSGRFGDALAKSGTLVQSCPLNSKTPDVLFKMGSIQEKMNNQKAARTLYRQIIEKHPQSETAADAADKLWLLEKPGRLLMTLVTPSGWTAYLDGEVISLPPEIFRIIPAWGKRIHYRYGRAQCLRVTRNIYDSAVFDKEDNLITWNDSSSSIMRLFTLRLEPGSGNHLLAVAARVSNTIPIRLESQMPGGMVGVLDCGRTIFVTDGTWRVSDNIVENWQNPSTSDETWEYASVYPNEDYGDDAWFWLYPKGFRKFPGYIPRIWGKESLGEDRILYFRKTFIIP